MMAVLMVTSLATSTLTQSVITYPSRGIQAAGKGNAFAFINKEYYWATAHGNSVRM
jgi:hypothetical protein